VKYNPTVETGKVSRLQVLVKRSVGIQEWLGVKKHLQLLSVCKNQNITICQKWSKAVDMYRSYSKTELALHVKFRLYDTMCTVLGGDWIVAVISTQVKKLETSHYKWQRSILVVSWSGKDN